MRLDARPITMQQANGTENDLDHAQLTGKLARLNEALLAHGGSGRSRYAQRLHAEIAATKAELEALEESPPHGLPIAERKSGRALPHR